MDNTMWILLYSKFSQACSQLFQLMEKNSISLKIELLDVDNKDIRRRILADKKFSIQTVPCIISLNSNGLASQYEGTKAFDVILAMCESSSEPVRPTETPAAEIETSKGNITLIEDLIDEQPTTTTTTTTVPGPSEKHASNAIKGEKISVSSVMSQMQKSEVNPRLEAKQQEILSQRSDPPLAAPAAKVNVSSIMSSVRS